ncbi:hypothetical protein FNV43_RR00394 [Rhamnella rubrinervis]|uniref:Uncharacterized protein n=1 Tax=Rhamnella rubrinervis TaxID=2594499 RepID=A0A8K0MRD1_9ROSA|nr:hypothetical protein FNV43_RR00394 [Rhamnella rubrinervis]
MESPGSYLVVEEQLVRKHSNRRASSSAGTPRSRQANEPDIEILIRTPSVRVDGLGGNRSRLIIMLPVLIKTEIPSIFKQSDMSYLKERFDVPSQVKLSARDPRRTDSQRRGKVHPLCSGRIRMFEDAPTSDKGWKDRYFFFKMEGLFDTVGMSESRIRSAWTERASNLSESLRITAEQKNVIRALLKTKTKSLLSILSEDSFRSAGLLYGVPTDPLWTSYPAADMGKLKMKISKAELEATKKKKRDKQAAAKGDASSQTDIGEEHPTFMVVVEPSSLPIAIPSGDSPPTKRQRRSSPPAPAQDKGKEKQTSSMLRLEDSSTIRSDSSMLTQNAWYLYDVVIKVDKAFKKKAEAYTNIVAANKTLEENSPALKQTAIEATKRAEWLERKWSEVDQKLIEKDKELEALKLDYAQVAGERDALQARVARWPRAKKHIYKKAAIDAIPKNTNDMIEALVGEAEGGSPTPTNRRMVRGIWRSPLARMSRMTEVPLLQTSSKSPYLVPS